MGLFKKVKDILFDEEEYTEQIKITPEMRNEPVKEEKKEVKVEAKPQIPKEEPKVQSEKEVFKNNNPIYIDKECGFHVLSYARCGSGTGSAHLPRKRKSVHCRFHHLR